MENILSLEEYINEVEQQVQQPQQQPKQVQQPVQKQPVQKRHKGFLFNCSGDGCRDTVFTNLSNNIFKFVG